MQTLTVANKTILVVQAHPDDADYYCGATIARFASQGANIKYLTTTDGSKGTMDITADPAEIARLRQNEQNKANKILGVSTTKYMNYPDLECPQGEQIREQLVREYRTIRPDILITFDPWKTYELHPDHTNTGREALYARLAAKMPLSFPQHIHQLGLQPVEIHELLLFKTDNPDFWIDATDFFDKKLESLLCHKSQFKNSDSLRKDLVQRMSTGDKPGRLMEGFKRISIPDMLD